MRRHETNSETEKRDFMHAYSFLRLESPVLLKLTATHLTGMVYLLTAVLVCEYKEIFIDVHTRFLSHLFSFVVFLFLNVRLISLIYVTASLFPRGLRDKTKTNGVPKGRKI